MVRPERGNRSSPPRPIRLWLLRPGELGTPQNGRSGNKKAPPGASHAEGCGRDLRFPVGRLAIEGILPLPLGQRPVDREELVVLVLAHCRLAQRQYAAIHRDPVGGGEGMGRSRRSIVCRCSPRTHSATKRLSSYMTPSTVTAWPRIVVLNGTRQIQTTPWDSDPLAVLDIQSSWQQTSMLRRI
jgi:hypothetical protein